MKYFLLCILSAWTTLAIAQSQYLGLSLDNWSGVASLGQQPANIVDSRHKLSVGFSGNLTRTTNFKAANFNNILGFSNNQKDFYLEKDNGYKSLDFSAEAGFMLELNKKNAIGYRLKVRTLSSVDGMLPSQSFMDFHGYRSDQNVDFIGQSAEYRDLAVKSMTWIEHNFHYGRVLYNKRDQFLKAGIGIKLINGLNSSYLLGKEGTLAYETADNSIIPDFFGKEGYFQTNGQAFEYRQANNPYELETRNLGFGGDIGFIYEYRPDYRKMVYKMDGVEKNPSHHANKYLYRIGISAVNLGSVQYGRDEFSYDFIGNPGSRFKATDVFNTLQNPTRNLLDSNFIKTTTVDGVQEDEFTMFTPATLNLTFDYKVWDNLYLAYSGSLPMTRKAVGNNVRDRMVNSIIPRYETINFSAALPLTVSENGQFNVGAYARWNKGKFSVVAGAHNITPLFGKRKIYDINAFFGMQYNINHRKPEDRDLDFVSDLKDRCPDDKGTWALLGCPDSDFDDIPDLEDNCIYAKGPKSTQGCPDTDGDGIIDLNDQCPENAGLAVHYGCPDRDKDGIIDFADRCPDVPGIEMNNGCPFENPGCCGDIDGDGVANTLDECPEISGSIYNKGCPIEPGNIDSIGLGEKKWKDNPNNAIKQVEETVEAEPKKEKAKDKPKFEDNRLTSIEDVETVLSVFKSEMGSTNIYYDYNQSLIKDEYRTEVEDWLERIEDEKNKNRVRYVIIGHTDSDGSDTYNLILSKKRAESAHRYLVNKGVKPKHIEIYYFGETQPAISNDNEVNKALNRRVEIYFVKK